MVGDPAVGKTALIQVRPTLHPCRGAPTCSARFGVQTFVSNGQRFPRQYMMTCGVELSVKRVAAPSSSDVQLHLFDCGGQDVFSELIPKLWQVDAKGQP